MPSNLAARQKSSTVTGVKMISLHLKSQLLKCQTMMIHALEIQLNLSALWTESTLKFLLALSSSRIAMPVQKKIPMLKKVPCAELSFDSTVPENNYYFTE